MPSAAQHFPLFVTLKNDEPITLEITQCSRCGLVQLSNEPVPYYRNVIRASGISPEMTEHRTSQFTSFIEDHNLQNKKILEVGCGSGEYLSIMNDLNVQAYGIEASRTAFKECLKLNLNVFHNFMIPHPPLPVTQFDAFYMLNFLEHLPYPNETLKAIHQNVTDNAVGIIEVPNFDMIIRNNLFSEFIVDHLTYFTKDTLQFILIQSGFEVLNISETWHDYTLTAIVRKRPHLDISRFHTFSSLLSSQITLFIDKHQDVAIWSAGHQAITVMSLSNLSQHSIMYVIDSAIFKQGRYTPVTHIPIVPPSRLITDPPKAIIVMGGSYSDEIIEQIKAKCGNIAISVVRNHTLEEIQ